MKTCNDTRFDGMKVLLVDKQDCDWTVTEWESTRDGLGEPTVRLVFSNPNQDHTMEFNLRRHHIEKINLAHICSVSWCTDNLLAALNIK